MKIDVNKTALVLIEPQNDFLKPGGAMYEYIKEQLKKRNVIQNLVDLINRTRGKIKIIFVPFHHFDPGFPELKPGGPATEGLRGIGAAGVGYERRLGKRDAWARNNR